jgi:hypothetical protein
MFLAYRAVLGLSFYGVMTVRGFLPTDEIAKRFGLALLGNRWL